MALPCGETIGHGETCSSFWLCSNCREKLDLIKLERAAIVRWLQSHPDPIVRNWISAQIEAGEHHGKPKED